MNTDRTDGKERGAARHPIGVAAERTGLSTDVIRAWERRYGAVEPSRDASGRRRYTDAAVERLGLLRRATEGGRSIGDVATLGDAALVALVREDEAARASRASGSAGADPAALESLALALDGPALEAALRRSLVALGLERWVEEVSVPLLRRLGDGWHAGEVTAAQEHLASVAVRRVLEGARESRREGPVAVVGTLAGERHETGALVAGATAALSGWRVVYLGPDLPVDEIVAAAATADAAAVLISAVYAEDRDALEAQLMDLRSRLPDEVTVYAGGGLLKGLETTLRKAGIVCPRDAAELRRTLER